MKNFSIILAFLFVSVNSFGQNKDKFFVTYGISTAFPAYNSSDIAGGGSFDGTGSFSFGFRYIGKSKRPVTLETGLEYSSHKYDRSPAFNPGLDMTPKSEKLKMLSVPVYANVTFFKYLFVNGGGLIDFEINKHNTVQKQSGIGFGFGLGGKYDFKRWSVMVNPFLQRHAFFAFDKTATRQSLLNSGFRIGLGYSL